MQTRRDMLARSATVAGLMAAAILANTDAALAERLEAWRASRTAGVTERPEGVQGASGKPPCKRHYTTALPEAVSCQEA